MKSINITEEQKEKLCEELARGVFVFRKSKEVKCIYFTPYKNDIEGDKLKLTIIRDNDKDDEINKNIREYNLSYQQEEMVRELGVKIFVDSVKRNDDMDLDVLVNSVILFDHTGEYIKMKKKLTSLSSDDENCVKINPPLEDELFGAIEAERAKRDTEAVRKFVKSDLFARFTNI